MRLSTDRDRDEERAAATVAAAVEAGITVYDTARAYSRDETELGHNERLLARALRAAGAGERARIVTKGGMARVAGGWAPDGRAKTLRADCEASLAALDGLSIDLYLIHAPDARTSWKTSVRALGRLADEGVVGSVGLSNVTRAQLDEALELAPIRAVQVALSPFDDRALRGGIVERCAELGIALLAHSPLGGPRKFGGLARHEALREVAAARGVSPAELALAWLLDLDPVVVPIPGARRPETARSAAHAAALELDDRERAALTRVLGARPVPRRRHGRSAGSEVVLVMGIPGAGKSRLAQELSATGYQRLNRDERGGSLRSLAGALDETLESGARRVVVDNTYLTRAARSYVLEVAARHAVAARCIWLDTPLAQAQVNLVERLLDRFDSLPTPDELRDVARAEPGLLAPTSQMRALRGLEPPSANEGFERVERIPFTRTPDPLRDRVGIFVAGAALGEPRWRHAVREGDPLAPHLLFDWLPEGHEADLAAIAAELSSEVAGTIEVAFCPHGGGPPICWCRPPLPGLPLAFARRHRVDTARSLLVGTSSAHRTLAATLGARFVAADV